MVVTQGRVKKFIMLFILDDVLNEVKISAGFRFLLMLHGNEFITKVQLLFKL